MAGASKELCKEWCGPNDKFAFDYLHERGFELVLDSSHEKQNFFSAILGGGYWLCAADFEIAASDQRAIAFLSEEWGYPNRIVVADEEIPKLKKQH